MLGEHIRLKIHRVARLGIAQIRVGKRMRCDPKYGGLTF